MWCDVIWCDVMWCDVMWCDVMWCNVMHCIAWHCTMHHIIGSHHITSHHITLQYIMILILSTTARTRTRTMINNQFWWITNLIQFDQLWYYMINYWSCYQHWPRSMLHQILAESFFAADSRDSDQKSWVPFVEGSRALEIYSIIMTFHIHFRFLSINFTKALFC